MELKTIQERIKMDKSNGYVGVLAGIVGVIAATYAYKKRDTIKSTVKSDFFGFIDNLKDKSATTIHKKVGYPVYNFIKKKENIPF